MKETEEDEMIRSIHPVAHGEAIFGPAVVTRVLAFFVRAREAGIGIDLAT